MTNDTKFPICLDEFKGFFMREAGLEYQPYPTWTKTVWDADDICYKDNVYYRSLVDLNRLEPPARPVPAPGFETQPVWEALTVIWQEGVEYCKGVIAFKDGAFWEAQEDCPEELPEGTVWANYWKRIDPKVVFPDARPWKKPVSYKKGDKVIAIVNFKPGVWVSQMDNNYSDPAKNPPIPNQEPEVLQWALSEEDTEEMEDWILDLDILRAMGEAIFKFNKSLFTEEKGKMIFLYLTMFFLVYDRQMAASGLGGGSAGAGPVLHRTVGKMSVTYMESKLFKNYPSYEFLASNDYGRKAFNLMMPYLRGGLRVLRGGSTGE